MDYFRWLFDSKYQGETWFIGEPRLPDDKVVSAWDFNRCQRIEPPHVGLTAAVKQGSERTPASFGAFDLLYVRSQMASSISRCADRQIQLIPVQVEKFNEEVFIVNVLHEVRCIDEGRSAFKKYLPNNVARPDKVGEYEMVAKLFIDPNATQGLDIFRPWGWKVALIVSERLKDVIEKAGAQGTKFQPVT